jgi:hypothetical protein
LIATAIGFQMKNNVLTSNEATYYWQIIIRAILN